MLSVRLPEEIEKLLESCAKNLKLKKSQIVTDALTLYLEDLKDFINAKRVLSRNEETHSHEDIKRELGL